jgi:hypothetical protein
MYIFDAESKVLKMVERFRLNKYSNAYPIISSISPDNKYAELHLYSCLHCDGGGRQTWLMNLETFKTKQIEYVSYFRWGTNGAYTYKRSAYYSCITPTMDGCPVDPSIIPLQYGTFE